MRITDEYRQQQAAFHVARPEYGISGHKWADVIVSYAQKMQTQDILDYGCGKATLQKAIPYPIHNYDPCVPEYSRRPVPAALVICSDVLEHIEPACLDAVLDDLRDLTQGMLFVTVATRPANKFLPDGRNAHLIQETATWWLPKLMARMQLHSFQNLQGEFHAILVPIREKTDADLSQETAHD